MKWLGLIIVLAATASLTGWQRRNPDAIPKILMLMGFLPWILGSFHLAMAFLFWSEWPGFVKGAEFSLMDGLALAVYFGLPGTHFPIPFRISMVLYFVAVLFSAFLAQEPIAALFYPWQLARVYLVYAAVTRACAVDPRGVPALMKGMSIGLFVEAGVALWQRFALGEIQTTGTEVHQNGLGMLSHFVVFPFFALLLTKQSGWLTKATTSAGFVVQLLTTSRATVGLAGFGYAVVFLLSAIRQWTFRKGLIMIIMVSTVAALSPVVISSFDRRFAVQDFGRYDERAALVRAAAMMLSDHPLGVGANHFDTAAIVDDYYARAGVAPTANSMTAQVHNVYWLVAAETGYLGLFTFIFLLLRPLTVAFLCGWRHRGDNKGDALLGMGVALLCVYIHSFFEWVLVLSAVQYMFALEVGMIVGLAMQLGYWRQPTHERRRLYRPGALLGSKTSQLGSTTNLRNLR